MLLAAGPELEILQSSLLSARIADITNYHTWLKVPIFFNHNSNNWKKISYKKALFIEMKTRKQPR